MRFISLTLRLSGYTLATFAIGSVLAITSAFLYLSPNLPAVSQLLDVQLQTPLRIYSTDNKLLGEFGEKRRIPIKYKDVPQSFINAILAAEDDRFLQHYGVDIKGLLRATSQLITTGHIQTGGSTITMQVAKNFFLSREKTFTRKFNEIFLALQIERSLSKSQILELYVNKIYLGHRAYGIAAAAQVYYGTSIDQLSLAQLAMIAGLPKAPSSFNPLANPSRALLRRNWIIGRMLRLGLIDQETYELAINETITAKAHALNIELHAPYIAEMARKEMLDRFGNEAYTNGYVVYTTVDSHLQAQAQKAVIGGLITYDKRHGYRGAEAQYPFLATGEVHEETGLDGTDVNETEQGQTQHRELAKAYWLPILQPMRNMGDMTAAIVSQVQEKSCTLLLADGSELAIEWQQGLSTARAFISNNKRGRKPQIAADVVSEGDLVRIRKNKSGQWQLGQIPKAQAALVSIDSKNGGIIALSGGFDFKQSKFNRITQAMRQPGSNFKPLIYSAALENGFTAATLINDAPLVFDDASLENTWRPANDSGKFYGPTRIRQALYKSRNLVSIRLLKELGISKAIKYVSRFGFSEKELPHDLSLALGSHALTPLKMVNVYATFANGGYRVEPYLIERILDSKNRVIFEASPLTVCEDCDTRQNAQNGDTMQNTLPSQSEQLGEESANIEEVLAQSEQVPLPRAERIVDERVAYIMDSILKDVIKKGTGKRALTLNRDDIAGKTGTTNGPTDAWFSGYGDDIATTAWLGFDQNQTLGRREYGGSAALPIWIEYMRTALRDRETRERKQPEGVASVLIDPKTGLRAKPGQKDAIFEVFLSEHIDMVTDSGSKIAAETEKKPAPEEIF